MKKLRLVALLLAVLIFGIFSVFFLTLPDASSLKKSNPKLTALMKQRQKEWTEAGKKQKIYQRWVAFNDIPDLLKKSVRISEDAGFYLHQGIDFHELEEAIKTNLEEGSFKRGASTITQQLAKNLYLSTDRSLWRKLREFFIAQRLEARLSKDRIFHIYLNVIEFGEGIYGIGAAASFYYNKTPSELTPAEIIRLTAIIPRPLKENPTHSSRWLLWRCCWITKKLFQYNHVEESEYVELTGTFCAD